jgi:hypothetical protein
MSNQVIDELLKRVNNESLEADKRSASQGQLIKYHIVYIDDGIPHKVESAYMSVFLSSKELERSQEQRLEEENYQIFGPVEIVDQGLCDSKINRYLQEKDLRTKEMDEYRSRTVFGIVNKYKYMYSSWSVNFTVDRFVSCIYSEKAISKRELRKCFKKSIEEAGAIKILRNTLKNGNEKICLEI